MDLYTDYSHYLRSLFGPVKMQKLSVNAGFSCPNRDGRIGTGGCIYCNNRGFTPSYCTPTDTVSEQLQKGKKFFARKYPSMRYLAYFQSYTSTYGSINYLECIYREALSVEGVDGLIIGTRPDCMPPETLSLLRKLNSEQGRIIVEFGAESTHDKTLRLINRNHVFATLQDAVERTAACGISCGIHLIMGLPGESREQMLTSVERIATMPIDTVKFHQLQIVRDTPLANLYAAQQRGEQTDFPQINLFDVEQYIDLCLEIIRIIPRRIAIERFTSHTPPDLLIAPAWGLKNYEFVHRLHAAAKE